MQTTEKMKHVVRGGLALLLTVGFVVILTFSHGVRAQSRSVEPDLTVHEWGTFTSIAGNEGTAVEWTPLSGIWPAEPLDQRADAKNVKLASPLGTSELPSFVEHFGYAGFKAGLRGTIRMETPVLYFYSPRDLTVSVNVAFSKGLITEWYPHASNVSKPGGFSPASLYKQDGNGTIAWNSVHLEPGQNASFPTEPGGHHYYAARETSAIPVRVASPAGDQHEKFLFYRGVSAGPAPISAKMTADGRMLVGNLGKEEIPAVILFERRGEKMGYRISNNLRSQVTLDQPELNANIDSLYGDLEEMLAAQGLYRDEAHAMVQTWRSSWFEEGSRLFYIVPTSYVNSVLPLTINPAAATTVRVFVGRMELVTPATERAVEAALAAHDQATIEKYSRFLEPILHIIGQKNPAKAKKLADLLNGPCACEENKPCDAQVAQVNNGQRKP